MIGHLICMNTKFFMRCQRNPISLPNVRIFFLYEKSKSTAHVYFNVLLYAVTRMPYSGHDCLYLYV